MINPLNIHTDGSCLGNPGPGGFAAIIEIPSTCLTVSGGDPQTTNNRMELMAVIEALRTVSAIPDLDETPIRIHSDSKYVVNAFNENWISGWLMRGWQNSKKQPVANRDLWEQLLTLVNKRQIEYVWVKGHSGDPMNEACDRLAVEQAEFARSQAGPWTSAGNPATATRNPSEMTAASRQAEPAAPVPADRGPDYHAGHADGYSEGRQLGYEAGYEACRQELDKFPDNLESGAPPKFADDSNGFHECRRQFLEFHARMGSNTELPF